MSDYIVRATGAGAQVRAFACTTRNTVETARQHHNTSPVVTAALGRLLSAGAMMGSMLKGEEDLLTLQIKGDGPVQGLMVTADAKGNVKGYANVPDVVLPANAVGKLDVAGAVGHGTLSVISVGLGVLMNRDNTVRQAGGFILQLMPFAEESVIGRLEQNLGRITSVTAMLDAGNTPEQMLGQILEGLDCEILETMPVGFHCNCHRNRIEKGLISLGKKEILDMIEEGQEIEINCQFCSRHYRFSVDELRELYRKSR